MSFAIDLFDSKTSVIQRLLVLLGTSDIYSLVTARIIIILCIRGCIRGHNVHDGADGQTVLVQPWERNRITATMAIINRHYLTNKDVV